VAVSFLARVNHSANWLRFIGGSQVTRAGSLFSVARWPAGEAESLHNFSLCLVLIRQLQDFEAGLF
jgi:hypothetical protein